MDIEIDKNLLDTVGCISVPNLDEDMPERVTKKEFKEALENYAQADKDWKDFCARKYLSKKEDAGDRLYKLALTILRNNGFYSYPNE